MYRMRRGGRHWREDWQHMPPYLKAVVASKRISEILSSSRLLPPSHPMSRAVTRVGRKIAQESEAPFMKWKFHVIEAKEPNAFCLPGGKVFVHSGLFKVLSNEDALAAVMFHEAAHGLARHGAEKISFSLLVYGLLAFVFPDYGQISDLMVKLAVDLPFSRKLELEADSIGLRLMAQADRKFKYFSTHPPSAERVQSLREQLHNALKVYEASGCGSRKQAFAKAMKPAFSPQGNATFDW
ncbi:hypothetical protein PRNP1_015413 [Phytophthora ramorum]